MLGTYLGEKVVREKEYLSAIVRSYGLSFDEVVTEAPQ